MEQIMRVKKEEAVLVAVDFQERLMPVIHGVDKLVDKTCRLIEGAKVLGLPILVTQQYTKGLGDTVEPIKSKLGDFTYFEKDTFSCLGSDEFKEALKATGRKQVLLCGIETHICVMQTALDLMEEGYEVFLVGDCCSSRTKKDSKVGVWRIAASGAMRTTAEMVLMEMTGGSKAEEFRAISKIIK